MAIAIRLEVTGSNQAWLNPFHPEVQQFLTDLIVDVVTRYDIDGIQLDDHFGLAVDFGYDPVTEDLYAAERGGMLPPLDSTAWLFQLGINAAALQAQPLCHSPQSL